MSNGEAKKPFERLPTNVIPVNYALQLTPDLQQFTFTGTVTIDVQVLYYKLTHVMTLITYSMGNRGNKRKSSFFTKICNALRN